MSTWKQVQIILGDMFDGSPETFPQRLQGGNHWLLDNENVVCGNTDEGCYPNSERFIRDFKETLAQTADTGLICHDFS